MTIAENNKKIREQYGLTQAELGDIAGVSDKAVSTWENGTAEPRMGAIQKIATHFNITKGAIVDDVPAHTPLYEAAAGPGRINDGYTDTISLQLGADEVAVAVKGDSMYPVLCDGDIAIVAATSVVSSEDDIMLVKINGDEATLKYVKKDSGGLYLYAENTDVFKRKFFTAEEVEEFPVTIEGVVVRFVREMK